MVAQRSALRSRVMDHAGRFGLKFAAPEIDNIFAALNQCHLPGAAVGIAIGGRPVYRRGFGLANIELPVVLSPTIRMRIASMSKHFTGLAYMLLCEEGKGGIDDPIGRHLPELHAVAHRVTARQLMGHTSGLRDVIDVGWQFGGRGRAVSSAELLALYREIDDVNAAPGATWIYNNGGWLLLTAMIERITGQSLEEVLRTRIFEPAGMFDTMLRRWDTDFVANSAALHMTSAAGTYDRTYLGMELTGDAGVVSTTDDMLRWLAHMNSPWVGSAATWKLMKTPQLLANGTSTGYGLGLVTDVYRGLEILYHDGGVMGGNSRMLKIPSLDLDIVVISNRQDAQSALLVNQIVDACVTGLDAAGDEASEPMVVGTFQSRRTSRVMQLYGLNGQQIAALDGFEIPCVRDRDGMFRPLQRYRMLKVELRLKGDRQHPTAVQLCEFGDNDEFTALPAEQKTSASSIAGTYRSTSVATEAIVQDSPQGTRLVMMSKFGAETFDLECLHNNIWRAKPRTWWPPGGILLFEADAQGFRFYSARTRALPFARMPRSA